MRRTAIVRGHCRHGTERKPNLKGEDIAAENRELDRKHKAEVERV